MREVILNFTEECNGRCTTCDIWRVKEPKVLPMDIIEKALASPALDGLQNLYLTGGEPFMTDQCIEIAKLLKRYHPGAVITGATNALGPLKYAQRIQRMSKLLPTRPSVSINGDRDWHDHTRGVKGSFDLTLDLIEIFRLTRIHYDIAFLDMGKPGQYDYVRGLADRLRVQVGVTRQRYSRRYNQVPKAPEQFVFPCRAPHEIICIWPNGKVTACEEDDPRLTLGNLYEEELEDMSWMDVSDYISAGKCQPCTMACYAGKW